MPSAGVEFNLFPEIAAEMEEASVALVRETAQAIEQDVKGGGPHAAPIRTGNLRRSYHTDYREPTHAEVGNDLDVAEYAIYVEYGTYKMAAQPHLRPATDAQRQPFLDKLYAILRMGH